MEAKDPSGIEHYLHYEFRDKGLLQEALRHSSYVNELADQNLTDNERFEFLGDAVLNLIVGHILMHRYPDIKEGELSRNRANLVNESQLAKMARSFELGNYIQLGKGEIQTQGREKKLPSWRTPMKPWLLPSTWTGDLMLPSNSSKQTSAH